MMRAILLATAALACGKPAPAPVCGQNGDAWLCDASVSVKGVGVAQTDCRGGVCQHNENTDLTAFKGALYLVHRTAMSQVLGPNSSLRISRSTDGGATFALVATLPAPDGRDLRDPHFFEVNGALHVMAITRFPITSSRDANTDSVSVGTSSVDGVTWSALAAIGPHGWSLWRPRLKDGTWYSAAYADGDQKVALFTSTDGTLFTQGADVYTHSEDTPLETELVFMPKGKLLALVRMDGNDRELFGSKGRLRTKTCWASPPYAAFECGTELEGQRLDGPLALWWGPRLFVVARKHVRDPVVTLGGNLRKRTALFELTGDFDGGPLAIAELGELPSAGDTAYAGAVSLDATRFLVSWYSSDVRPDIDWIDGMLGATDIWLGTIDFSRL